MQDAQETLYSAACTSTHHELYMFTLSSTSRQDHSRSTHMHLQSVINQHQARVCLNSPNLGSGRLQKSSTPLARSVQSRRFTSMTGCYLSPACRSFSLAAARASLASRGFSWGGSFLGAFSSPGWEGSSDGALPSWGSPRASACAFSWSNRCFTSKGISYAAPPVRQQLIRGREWRMGVGCVWGCGGLARDRQAESCCLQSC